MAYSGDYDIFDEFRRMMREMDRLMSSMIGEVQKMPMGSPEVNYREPLVDLNDTGEEIIVTAELPGVSKDRIELSIVDDMLEIRTAQGGERTVEREGYKRRERRSSDFFRRIALPVSVDPSSIKAIFNNGVLEVRMPKLYKVDKHNISIE